MNPIEIINQHSDAIARSLDIMVYSLEGLFEKTVRENPTMGGIREFWARASDVSAESIELAVNKLTAGIDDLRDAVVDSKHVRVSYDDDDSAEYIGEAYEAFGAFFAQAKVFYAKRLRAVVVSKSVGFDSYSADPKIMLRNGQQWNFSQFAYLTTRQLLIDWHNNIKINSYAAAGVEEYSLLTDDPELTYAVFRVDEYADQSAQLFHPRTTKLVGAPYVSTESEV